LALAAFKTTYNQPLTVISPLYREVKFENNKAILSFDNIGSGLKANDKYGYLKGFEIAGEDKKFYYAQAQIVDNKVVVYQTSVAKPVAVRYAWSDAPVDANLFNQEGLPASPFRTDSWDGLTVKNQYER
jgi:sialate O-acetylesterase